MNGGAELSRFFARAGILRVSDEPDLGERVDRLMGELPPDARALWGELRGGRNERAADK